MRCEPRTEAHARRAIEDSAFQRVFTGNAFHRPAPARHGRLGRLLRAVAALFTTRSR